MSRSCKNPACSERAWWAGFCRLCFQTTGVADQFAAQRLAEEQAAKANREHAEFERVRDRLIAMGDDGTLAWWEVSERLNAAGMKWMGRRFTPGIARGRYLALTAHDWE
jgi:hypothetical protein